MEALEGHQICYLGISFHQRVVFHLAEVHLAEWEQDIWLHGVLAWLSGLVAAAGALEGVGWVPCPSLVVVSSSAGSLLRESRTMLLFSLYLWVRAHRGHAQFGDCQDILICKWQGRPHSGPTS